jgi:hypothetical protein
VCLSDVAAITLSGVLDRYNLVNTVPTSSIITCDNGYPPYTLLATSSDQAFYSDAELATNIISTSPTYVATPSDLLICFTQHIVSIGLQLHGP